MLKLMVTLLVFWGVSATAQQTKFRDWEVNTTHDKVTQKRTGWASTDSKRGKTKYGERPFMGINCDSVYFGNVAVLDDGDVTWRFDNQSKAHKMYGDRWQGGKGTTIDFKYSLGTSNSDKAFRYYKTHFKDFISAKELYVKFDMYASEPLQVTFSLMGVTAAINRLQDDCWVDKDGTDMSWIFFLAHYEANNDLLKKSDGFRGWSEEKVQKFVNKLEKKYGYDRLD